MHSNNDSISTDLRAVIGKRLNYRGQSCEIIDLIPADPEQAPKLVLALPNSADSIQTDQFGKARRRAPEVVTVSACDERSGQLRPAIAKLLA